jgi:hypothetical protein
MKTFLSRLDFIFTAILGVLTPVAPIIYTLTFIIICDFIFGIYRAYKCKEEITSRKMAQTLPKLLLYNVIIIALFLVDKYVMNTGIGLEKVAATLMILIEMKSVDESFKIIFGYSLWNKVIDSIERGKSITKK